MKLILHFPTHDVDDSWPTRSHFLGARPYSYRGKPPPGVFGVNNKSSANANRSCDCSVLCLRPKSSLCSCPDCILGITSFGSADSMRRASNYGVGQFKPIFQVEGNTFRLIFLGYFIADCLLYKMLLEVFTQQNSVADFIRLKLNFIPKNQTILFSHPLGDRGNIRTPSIVRWKALLDFLFAITEFVRYLLRLRRYKRKYVEVGVFRRGWVSSRLKFRLKGTFRRQYLWTVRYENGSTTTLLLEVFTQRNFVADFIRL